MIDTIAISLDASVFTIIDHKRFDPSTAGLFGPNYYPLTRGAFHCKQNPTKQDGLDGIYKPRLTATRRAVRGGHQLVLKVEFSAPKLLFGNNFQELRESDLDRIVDQLVPTLKSMGVLVRKDKLLNADVVKIDYGKNILLKDGLNVSYVLRQFAKADITQLIDTAEIKYRNNGHSYKFHTNSYEFIAYDKLKDLHKSKTSPKRSEKSDDYIQLKLLDAKKSDNKEQQILRFEARYISKRFIRSQLKRLGFDLEPTLENCFSQKISLSAIGYYLDIIDKGYSLIENDTMSIASKLEGYIAANPNTKINDILIGTAIKQLANDVGVRQLRSILSGFSNSSWYRVRDIATGLDPPKQSYSLFDDLKNEIIAQNSFSLDDLYYKIVSNVK